MPSTYSSNLKIELMSTGENSGTWGNITNTNLGTALEQAVVGYGAVSYASDANLTISITNSNAAQAARALVLNVTSALSLTATRELVVPTIEKQYIVQNNTTGSQSITVKTSAGTGITVPNGRKAHLYVDGTNVIQMFDFVDINGGTIDGTPIGGSSAAAGAFTTLNASGATTLDGNVTLGNASGDNVTVTGTITSNLLFTDNTYDIGASGATRPRNLFLAGAATIGGNLSVGGTLTLTGGLILNGNVTVGDSSADTLTVNATITSNLLFTDNTYDIGASGATRPRNLFLAGNATIGGNQTLTGALTVDSTTDSSSTITGSIQTDGGLGVAKAIYVGTTANIAGAVTLGGGTANGVAYLNASKVLTTTSNFTWSGDRLALTSAEETGAAAPIISTVNANAGETQLKIFHSGANLGIYNNRNAALYFGTNNTFDMALYAGALSIGDAAYSGNRLSLVKSNSATVGPVQAFKNLYESSGTTAGQLGLISFGGWRDVNPTGSYVAAIEGYDAGYPGTFGFLRFFTTDNGDNDPQYPVTSGRLNLLLGPNESVFNDSGLDMDFRVESDLNTHMLFVDGGNDAVGIGMVPLTTFGNRNSLEIGGNTVANLSLQAAIAETLYNFYINGSGQSVYSTNGPAGFQSFNNAVSAGWSFQTYPSGTAGALAPAGTDLLALSPNGTIFNEGGVDIDFRVESDTNTHAFFLDAGNSRIGMGVSNVHGGLMVQNYASTFKADSPWMQPAGRVYVTTEAGNAGVDHWYGFSGGYATASGSVNILLQQNFGDLTSQGGNYIGSEAVGTGTADFVLGKIVCSTDINTNATKLEQLRVTSAGGLVTKPAVGGSTVFNENGVNADFRIESDTDTHALFISGSGGEVMMGTNGVLGTGAKLNILSSGGNALNLRSNNSSANNIVSFDSAGNAKFVVKNTGAVDANVAMSLTVGANGGIFLRDAGGNPATNAIENHLRAAAGKSAYVTFTEDSIDDRWAIGTKNGDSSLYFKAGTITATDRIIFASGGGAIFNEQGNDSDFRVESDTNTHMFFVDTSTNRVSIGTSDVPGRFTVNQSEALPGVWISDNRTGGRPTITMYNREINSTGNGAVVGQILFGGFRDVKDPSYASAIVAYNNSAGLGNSGVITLCAGSNGEDAINQIPPTQLTVSTGAVAVAGALSKGSGSFKIDHPLPRLTETHHLVHSFIEGPQADLIYRGKATLVAGRAEVNIDQVAGMTEGTFVVLCRDVQCFTSNESDWTPVRGSVSGNVLTIEAQDTASTATVSWMVIGERQDKHMYDTNWTDENGKVIVEPLKQPTP